MKIQFYKSNGQWRWRVLASNGRQLCNPGESFRRREDCFSNVARVLDVQFEFGAQETHQATGRSFKLEWPKPRKK